MRLLSVVAVVVVAALCVAADKSGDCGEGVTWKIDEANEVLTIEGNGKMTNFSRNTAPWSFYQDLYTKVVIKDGVKSIGDYAFYNSHENVTDISFEGTFEYVGSNAFQVARFRKIDIRVDGDIADNAFYKAEFSELKLAGNIGEIGQSAFAECDYFTIVALPQGLVNISKNAFNGCNRLKKVLVPSSVSRIEEGAFSNCKELTTFYYMGIRDPADKVDVFAKTPVNQVLVTEDYVDYECCNKVAKVANTNVNAAHSLVAGVASFVAMLLSVLLW